MGNRDEIIQFDYSIFSELVIDFDDILTDVVSWQGMN